MLLYVDSARYGFKTKRILDTFTEKGGGQAAQVTAAARLEKAWYQRQHRALARSLEGATVDPRPEYRGSVFHVVARRRRYGCSCVGVESTAVS